VVLDVQAGARGSTLAFDREREEIRLNPALEGLLGLQALVQWREAREELLARPAIRVGDVLDIFGTLAQLQGRTITSVPTPHVRISANACEIVPCAALFNAEFTGQAVSEDLHQLRNVSPAGTGLDAALRVSPDSPTAAPYSPTREVDRFVIVPSDPSQDTAVLRARIAPGLLVEGPPGTGKSQTIVNMVADAIGRGETVLIVCQKQAALKVVQKRLEAEGLGERLFLVVDINRDREGIVRALRDQVVRVRVSLPDRLASLKRKRQELAARIETMEGEIDRNHHALHEIDELSGSSYRHLLAELIGLEEGGTILDAPTLRHHFVEINRDEIIRIEEACSPLARLWLQSRYEGSPLNVLRQFSVDAATRRAFLSALSAFVAAEQGRQGLLAAEPASFETDDPEPYRHWLDHYGPMFLNLPVVSQQGLIVWFDLFKPQNEQHSHGDAIIDSLNASTQSLSVLNERWHDPALFPRLVSLRTHELERLIRSARKATSPASFIGRISFSRWRHKRRLHSFLKRLGEETTESRVGALRKALDLEFKLRGVRAHIGNVKLQLRIAPRDPAALSVVRQELEMLVQLLSSVQKAAAAALACPRPTDAERMAKSGAATSFIELKQDFETALKRSFSRKTSRAALERLSQWIKSEWITDSETRIAEGLSNEPQLAALIGAVGTLESYQRFRVRASEISPNALNVFATLREQQEELEKIQGEGLEDQFRRIIKREALLAWKGRLESAKPALIFEREEIESKIKVLETLDKEFREHNHKVLAADFDPTRLGAQTEWDDITRLRGPRMKRLREILDHGADIGLMMLRPIWLMNPDVASRILPRQPQLFDLVIYDEASQMLVEHAVPTLFRAKRVVISGDEKQMPPSSFFTTRIDSDEDEEGDEDLDDLATEAERIAHEEQWNRREIKDCPDLLQLGRGVLPSTTLQVHYRSKYRELIGYSNAAFYRGTLSIPARHPDDEIRRVKPIDVIRVNGIYEQQTNKAEAEKVVEVLADIWKAAPDRRPTVGVATFNRKQADLVEDAIEKRAIDDSIFLHAYQRECERTRDGEDVGFFVKNVENVQGDERDIIIFSTTFGHDKHGTFRRYFGVLGQSGGERRLNVAVTRAREKIVLLTSMPVEDISEPYSTNRAPSKPREYLQAYLDYALKIAAGELELARAATQRLCQRAPRRPFNGHDDGFVASVGAFIRQIGYSPIPSNEGDAFGLDFAIKDDRTGLFGIGIECDAPRHNLLRHARAREIWRPAVLSRAIPTIHRVGSQAWYHHPAQERERLRAAVENALSRDLI
jgi:hypothetical protein